MEQSLKATKQFLECLEITKKTYGENKVAVAIIMNLLGINYNEQKKY